MDSEVEEVEEEPVVLSPQIMRQQPMRKPLRSRWRSAIHTLLEQERSNGFDIRSSSSRPALSGGTHGGWHQFTRRLAPIHPRHPLRRKGAFVRVTVTVRSRVTDCVIAGITHICT